MADAENTNLTNADLAVAIYQSQEQTRLYIEAQFGRLPCINAANGNPLTRIAVLEEKVAENRKRMGIIEKIGGGIATLLTAVAAWFASQGGLK